MTSVQSSEGLTYHSHLVILVSDFADVDNGPSDKTFNLKRPLDLHAGTDVQLEVKHFTLQNENTYVVDHTNDTLIFEFEFRASVPNVAVIFRTTNPIANARVPGRIRVPVIVKIPHGTYIYDVANNSNTYVSTLQQAIDEAVKKTFDQYAGVDANDTPVTKNVYLDFTDSQVVGTKTEVIKDQFNTSKGKDGTKFLNPVQVSFDPDNRKININFESYRELNGDEHYPGILTGGQLLSRYHIDDGIIPSAYMLTLSPNIQIKFRDHYLLNDTNPEVVSNAHTDLGFSPYMLDTALGNGYLHNNPLVGVDPDFTSDMEAFLFRGPSREIYVESDSFSNITSIDTRNGGFSSNVIGMVPVDTDASLISKTDESIPIVFTGYDQSLSNVRIKLTNEKNEILPLDVHSSWSCVLSVTSMPHQSQTINSSGQMMTADVYTTQQMQF